MRITRVELTNIKSYKQAIIELRGGVTAIRGHNGAGKSTLLEAIGWALFDALPYKQEQFVREGEAWGKVAVSFLSPLDDREYQVSRRCGSRGSDWAIYDPETGTRIDSTADVKDFLRHHLRIESSITLKDLFTSALGAPQGTLTSDFLQTPANRSKKFDTLLQVEDYPKSFEKLRDTARYLRERRAEQDVRIATLEGEAGALDDLRAALAGQQGITTVTTQQLATLDGDLEAAEARHRALEHAHTEVVRRQGEAVAAETAHAAAARRAQQTSTLLTEARAASAALAQARPDHEAYLRAEARREATRERVITRDTLIAERAELSRQREGAAAAGQAARQRLEEVAQAERRIVALQEACERQTEAERKRDEAGRGVRRLSEIETAARGLAARRAALANGLRERAAEVARVEAARPLAALLPERRRVVEELQALAATREQRERRREAISRERAAVAERRTSAQEKQQRHVANVRKLEDLRPLAESLPACEQRAREAEQAMREVETHLAQQRLAREQSGAGNCPFLREPCQNIRQRGENSLGAYFDRIIAEDERRLIPLSQACDEAQGLVNGARYAATYYNQLDQYRTQLEEATGQLVECEGDERRLAGELAEIEATLARAGAAADLKAAREALATSEQADRLVATLDATQRALDALRAQDAELAADAARYEQERMALAGAQEAQREALTELAELGDPRSEVLAARRVAATRSTVEERQSLADAECGQIERKLAGVEAALAPYAHLNQEISALEAEAARARPGHLTYLRHEQTAERLPEREREHAEASSALMAAEQALSAARAALAEAESRFDAPALEQVIARANDLRSRRGQLRETLRHAEEEIVRLGDEIIRAEEARAELERARVERDELEQTEKMLDQFRDTLKEAGPLVTRALRDQISIQANAIFGEIMGDRSAQLVWGEGYEVILKRDGAERVFAQLSGGEQMAAALATRLALLRRLTRLDMAFFDEPTQNMDSDRRSALAEQIRRVRGFDQLIVISHDDTFEQGLDSVIHLEKRGGVTVVSDDESSFETVTPFTDSLVGQFGVGAVVAVE